MRLSLTAATHRLMVAAACLAILVLVFLPTFTVEFAQSDDYFNLDSVQTGRSLALHYWAAGRPLYGELLDLGFGWSNTVASLRFLRIFAFAGLIVTWGIARRTLRTGGIEISRATMLATAYALMPAFAVYVSWATCFVYCWATAAALAAGLLIDAAATRPDTKPRVILLALGLLLSLSSMLTYQPAAMSLLLVPTFVALQHGTAHARRLVWPAVAMAVVLALGYLVLRITNVLLFRDDVFARASLTNYPFAKARWFFGEVLVAVLNLHSARQSTRVAAVIASVTAAGALLSLRSRRIGKAAFGWAMFAVVFAYLPNLLVEESWASFRTQAAIGGVTLLLVYAAAIAVLRELNAHARTIDGAVAVSMIAAAAIGIWQVNALVVHPQQLELGLVRYGVANTPPTSSLCLVPATESDAAAPFVRYDELGRPSTAAEWSRIQMLRVVQREQGRDPQLARDSCNNGDAGRQIDIRVLATQPRWSWRDAFSAR